MELPESLVFLNGFFMAAAFILGTAIGSFCNVCISRWPAGESVIRPRSRCPKCLNAITWHDNIPLLSWLALGAKCRHCGLPISAVYPAVEAITGALFLLVYWRFGLTAATPVYMAFCASLVIVTFQDLADWTIPDEISLPGIPAGILIALAAMGWGPDTGLRVLSVFDAMGGAALGGGMLLALDRITVLVLKKPGMGFGDVKLLAMIGAFLGWMGALGTLIIASVLGSVVGLGLILHLRRRANGSVIADAPPVSEKRKDSDEETITLEGHYLPFGPYLALGALVFLFVGPEVIQAYFAFVLPAHEPLRLLEHLGCAGLLQGP